MLINTLLFKILNYLKLKFKNIEYQYCFLFPLVYSFIENNVTNDTNTEIEPITRMVISILFLATIALSNSIYFITYFVAFYKLNISENKFLNKYPLIKKYLNYIKLTNDYIIWLDIFLILFCLLSIVIICLFIVTINIIK